MTDLIIFDCDGVLVDSEMIASTVLAACISEQGHPLSAAECRRRFTGKSLASVFDELANDVTLPDDFIDTLRARDRAAFDADLKAIAFIADTLRALTIPRCVASSGRLEKINHSLTLTNLINFFDGNLFSAEMVDNGKPAPDLFLFAAETMNTAPRNCVVIEDSTAGVQAAKAAAMTVYGFTGGAHCDATTPNHLRNAGADHVFNDMRDLPGLLGL